MEINPNFYHQYQNKVNQNSKPQNFKGLFKPMQKQVFITPEVYQNYFIPYTKESNKRYIGSLPDEFIQEIIKTSKKSEVEPKIKTVMNAFSLAAQTLSRAEYSGARIKDNFSVKYFMDRDTGILHTPGEAYYYSEDYYGVNSLEYDELKPFLDSASSCLTNAFRKAGLISSDDDRVYVNYSGSGTYGNVYNISFVDKEGSDIFHPKTLKVYKNDDIEESMTRQFAKRIIDYHKNLSFEEFLTPLIQDYYLENKLLNPELTLDEARKSFISKYDDLYKDLYDEAKSLSEDDFMKKYYTKDETLPYHGLFAEANRAMFLKSKFPDIKNSNYVEPFFFDLKSGCALFETADFLLDEPKFELPLEKVGCENMDLLLNDGNTACGRVVDYGGIAPKTE